MAVTKPRYVMQFDPGLPCGTGRQRRIQPAYKAYPELASGDEILQEVLARLNPRPERVETLRDLRDDGNGQIRD